MQALTRLAALSPVERARVLARLRGDSTAPSLAARDVPAGLTVPAARPGDGPAVASFLQEQLWFLDQLVGGEPVYNVPFSFRLRGPLDSGALLDAVRAVIARHDVLSGRLVVEGGRLVQARGPAPEPSLAGVDPKAAAGRLGELARTRFDLAGGPLLRVELLRLDRQDHMLAWVAHHTVLDGWSVGLLVDELRAAYQGRPLDPVPSQYADFARWQRERLSGAGLGALLDHWRGRLDGASFSGVPADLPRPPVQTFTGGIERFELGAGLTATLRELAGAHRTTLFATLLAAYQVLAASQAGTDEAIVGVPVAGRTSPQLQSLVGPVSNTVPVRVDLSGDPTFGAALAATSEAMLDAAAHHEVPLGRLVGALGAGRDIGRNPLFGLVFNMETLPTGAGSGELGPGLAVTANGHPNGTVRMDLELTFERNPDGGLDGRLEYNVDLYRPATVRRLATALRGLLAAVAADPDRRLSTIGAISAGRRETQPVRSSAGLVSEWLAGPEMNLR